MVNRNVAQGAGFGSIQLEHVYREKERDARLNQATSIAIEANQT